MNLIAYKDSVFKQITANKHKVEIFIDHVCFDNFINRGTVS